MAAHSDKSPSTTDCRKPAENFFYGTCNTAVQSDLADNPMCFPSLEEQKIIAAYLDYKVGQIDKSISANIVAYFLIISFKPLADESDNIKQHSSPII